MMAERGRVSVMNPQLRLNLDRGDVAIRAVGSDSSHAGLERQAGDVLADVNDVS